MGSAFRLGRSTGSLLLRFPDLAKGDIDLLGTYNQTEYLSLSVDAIDYTVAFECNGKDAVALSDTIGKLSLPYRQWSALRNLGNSILKLPGMIAPWLGGILHLSHEITNNISHLAHRFFDFPVGLVSDHLPLLFDLIEFLLGLGTHLFGLVEFFLRHRTFLLGFFTSGLDLINQLAAPIVLAVDQ